MGSRLTAAVILFSVTVGLGLSARADTFPPGAQEVWSKYFPGKVLIPDPEENLDQLIPSIEPRCAALQKQILAQTIQYGRDAFLSDLKKTKQESTAILDTLHGLESSKDVCFDSVARVYLAASVHLLAPLNSDPATFSRIDGHHLPEGLTLTLLGAAILDHRTADGSFSVQFLTPAKRAEKSPTWRQKTGPNQSAYLVSAGYDCVSQEILIDPYLPPLDVAGVFVHELDHLFRDRIDSKDSLVSQVLTVPESPLDLSAQIVMDETLASVVSAYYQKHMQFLHIQQMRKFHIGTRTTFPFRLSDDLTLFDASGNGALDQIWSLFDKANTLPGRDFGFSPTASYFLAETFLRAPRYYATQPKQFAEPASQVQQIYQTIARGYFDGRSLSADMINELDPSIHGIQDDPLSLFLNNYDLVYENDDQVSFTPNAAVNWIREVPAEKFWDGLEHQHPIVRIVINLDFVFKGLDLFLSQIFGSQTPSPYCSLYLSGLQDGELSSYVGGNLSTGFKSGETGNKPGETGNKPGETGNKPDLFRPCLNIGPTL